MISQVLIRKHQHLIHNRIMINFLKHTLRNSIINRSHTPSTWHKRPLFFYPKKTSRQHLHDLTHKKTTIIQLQDSIPRFHMLISDKLLNTPLNLWVFSQTRALQRRRIRHGVCKSACLQLKSRLLFQEELHITLLRSHRNLLHHPCQPTWRLAFHLRNKTTIHHPATLTQNPVNTQTPAKPLLRSAQHIRTFLMSSRSKNTRKDARGIKTTHKHLRRRTASKIQSRPLNLYFRRLRKQ